MWGWIAAALLIADSQHKRQVKLCKKESEEKQRLARQAKREREDKSRAIAQADKNLLRYITRAMDCHHAAIRESKNVIYPEEKRKFLNKALKREIGYEKAEKKLYRGEIEAARSQHYRNHYEYEAIVKREIAWQAVNKGDDIDEYILKELKDYNVDLINDLGFDEMDIFELILRLEDEFNIDVPGKACEVVLGVGIMSSREGSITIQKILDLIYIVIKLQHPKTVILKEKPVEREVIKNWFENNRKELLTASVLTVFFTILTFLAYWHHYSDLPF